MLGAELLFGVIPYMAFLWQQSGKRIRLGWASLPAKSGSLLFRLCSYVFIRLHGFVSSVRVKSVKSLQILQTEYWLCRPCARGGRPRRDSEKLGRPGCFEL